MRSLSPGYTLLAWCLVTLASSAGCAVRETPAGPAEAQNLQHLQHASWPLPGELPAAAHPNRQASASAFLSSDVAGIIDEVTQNYSYAGANIRLAPTSATNFYIPNLAYVAFDFWAPGTIDPPVIKADFVGIEPEQQQVFIGLANWTTNRWDWQYPGTVLVVDDFAPYIQPETARLVALLVVTGAEPLFLRELRVGQGGTEEPRWRTIQPSAYPAERTNLQLLGTSLGPAVMTVENVAEGADYRQTAMLYRCLDSEGFEWQPPVAVYRAISLNNPLQIQAAKIGGRAAVVTQENFFGDIFVSYARSEDDYGAVWPTEFPLIETGDAAEGFAPVKLLEADGYPAVIINKGVQAQYFAARDVEGAQWRPLVEIGAGETALDAMMLNGRPGILTSRSIIGENALHFFWSNDAAGLTWPVNGAHVFSDFVASDFFYRPRLLNLFTNPAVVLLPGNGQGLSMIASSSADGSVWPLAAQEIDANGYTAAVGALGDGFDTFVASVNDTVNPLTVFYSSDGFGTGWGGGAQLAFEGSSPTELVAASFSNHAVFATTSTNPTDPNLSQLLLYWY